MSERKPEPPVLDPSPPVDTHRRALAINLNAGIYGTFAEIGAGQEVVRWFFQVGGAAGTVAKSISAYDMSFSDAIYGKAGRYVSRERLRAMLDHEYQLLLERLDAERAAKSKFFSFADTVSARNYAGINECHGWMGLRFQNAPLAQPSDILLHVNMMDPTNDLQQQALGILGVNVVYAAQFDCQSIDALLKSLFEGLTLERIEIDAIELTGPAFEKFDRKAIGLKLIHGGYASAILYDAPSAEPLPTPSEVLRKRPIVLERGLFATDEAIHAIEPAPAIARITAECGGTSDREPLFLCEMTTKPRRGEMPSEDEFMRRIEALHALGLPVLITRFEEAFHLTEYLRRYTKAPLRFAFGLSTLVEILQDSRMENLVGGLFEALGRLFAENVRLYVYAMNGETFRRRLTRGGLNAEEFCDSNAALLTIHDVHFAPPLNHLAAYLLESGWLESVTKA